MPIDAEASNWTLRRYARECERNWNRHRDKHAVPVDPPEGTGSEAASTEALEAAVARQPGEQP